MEMTFPKWILEDKRSKCPGQKYKSLLLMQCILECADDEHPVAIMEIEEYAYT